MSGHLIPIDLPSFRLNSLVAVEDDVDDQHPQAFEADEQGENPL